MTDEYLFQSGRCRTHCRIDRERLLLLVETRKGEWRERRELPLQCLNPDFAEVPGSPRDFLRYYVVMFLLSAGGIACFLLFFRDPASPNAACGIFVVVLLAFFFGKRPRGERFSSFFFDSPLQNNALKIPFSEEKRNEAQAFAVEVARLSIRHFQMPSPERDPEKLRLQLRRLREESILSGEEVRELEKWYAIAGEERPNIGFLRKEDA